MQKNTSRGLRIEHVSIATLKVASYNPRTWDAQATKDLKESIVKYGIVDPLLVNSAPKRKDIVIGGHFRLKEDILIFEMLAIIDTMSLDKSELKTKLEKEVARYALFQTGVLGQELVQSKKHKDISIKIFAKYILQHGTLTEKREVLSCVKSGILLKDKKLVVG